MHFNDILQQYNEKAGFKGPLANIGYCMHLLRCDSFYVIYDGISARRTDSIPRYSPTSSHRVVGVAAKSPPVDGRNTNREGQELVQQYTPELHIPTKTFLGSRQVFECRPFV